MTVVALHKARTCDHVVAGLRKMADRIEAGEIDWPVTTCAVVIGHTGSETRPNEDGTSFAQNHWETYAFGPRTDSFTRSVECSHQ